MEGRRGPAKRAISAAAAELFAEHGYARTSVRQIARRAGVDPALVVRYFGSKEELFTATMSPDADDILPRTGPLDDLGESLVRAILHPDSPLRTTYLGLVRASDADGIGSALRDMHEAGFVGPLVAVLEGDDVELRARLIAAMVGGLMYSLWIVEDRELLDADPDAVVARYGAQLQALING